MSTTTTSGNWVDRYFHITERGSDAGTEVRAGFTTFLTMAYIILVNPSILSVAIMLSIDALIVATAHHIRARWLLTGNAADYRRCTEALSSPVEVVAATEPPPSQQVILEVIRSTPHPIRTRPVPDDDDGAP